jgi:cell division transport system permease protein
VLSVTLFLFGGVIAGHSVIKRILSSVKNDLTIAVYLEDNTTPEIVGKMMIELEKIAGVKKVVFRSKEDALKKFRKMMGNDIDEIFNYLDVNPLPASFLVKIDDGEKADEIIKKIGSEFPINVSNISFSGKTYEKLSAINEIFKNVSTVMVLILTLASMLTIFTSVILTIHSRREEIETMQLVGATRFFIMVPFIFESLLIGIISSSLAIIMLYALKVFLLSSLIVNMPVLLPFLKHIPSINMMTTLVLISISLCLAGTLIGIRRTLK